MAVDGDGEGPREPIGGREPVDQLCKQLADESLDEETVEEFKHSMYQMQEVRRRIVKGILKDGRVNPDDILVIRKQLETLGDQRTSDNVRQMHTTSQSFAVNVKDEVHGLSKDITFFNRLSGFLDSGHSVEDILDKADIPSILAPFHPISPEKFYEEMNCTIEFLQRVCANEKPAFVTDWDGTMKDYCSQYATNLQPVYSALCMARFASEYTRLAAVLTAGPLRGPGILDLTALPIDGPVVFSGSWGREWWLAGKRVVHDDGISDEGFDALERLNDEMGELLDSGDFSQFGLVGSGVQRKVDRLTLGVQTVCGHVEQELSHRYQDAVRERMHRVDPYNQILVFDRSTDLEVEVCVHNSGSVWNKADGVQKLMATIGNTLAKGKVLIAGDTGSDLPMVEYAMRENPKNTHAFFVGAGATLRENVRKTVGDDSRVCFVSCPDVFHAAVARLIVSRRDID